LAIEKEKNHFCKINTFFATLGIYTINAKAIDCFFDFNTL